MFAELNYIRELTSVIHTNQKELHALLAGNLLKSSPTNASFAFEMSDYSQAF